jgi:CubicO group peptidase (beta-lactamase class C family)
MPTEIEQVLDQAVAGGALKGAAAAVVTPKGIDVAAAGEGAPGRPMTTDTVVWLASMTKTVTAVAAMQLVEQGRVDLDAPLGALVPYLGEVGVLDGFEEDGTAKVRRPSRPVTLRHLLTHTSGFGYPFCDDRLTRYMADRQAVGRAWFRQPLLADPGEHWHYGIGMDWAGQVIEAVTGSRLDRHLRSAVLDPLAMHDTGFRLSDAAPAPDRIATMFVRSPDGQLIAEEPGGLDDPSFLKGGSGLHGTVADYLRLVRMILGDGELDGRRLLAVDTVRLMASNHIGALSADGWRSADPSCSNDVNFYPAMHQQWGLSFLINAEATPEGRASGSLAWGGLANTYFWIDPASQVAGVIVTQVLPFFDGPSLDVFRSVERLTYASL